MYATGPSLTREVLEITHAQPGWRHIAISDYYRHGYPCDFYYACDQRWWNKHYEKVMEWGGSANGYWCTESRTIAAYPNLRRVNGKGGQSWSTDPQVIHYGGNSGFQILNIAFLLGLKRIILIGFNMCIVKGQSHFFGDHPEGLSRNTSYQSFASEFDRINPQGHGVTVINCSKPTALKAFPVMDLEDGIKSLS